jgi:hypothetical protein
MCRPLRGQHGSRNQLLNQSLRGESNGCRAGGPLTRLERQKNSPLKVLQQTPTMQLRRIDYLCSQQLKDWVKKNKDCKYVPLDLLEAWNFEAEGE